MNPLAIRRWLGGRGGETADSDKNYPDAFRSSLSKFSAQYSDSSLDGFTTFFTALLPLFTASRVPSPISFTTSRVP